MASSKMRCGLNLAVERAEGRRRMRSSRSGWGRRLGEAAQRGLGVGVEEDRTDRHPAAAQPLKMAAPGQRAPPSAIHRNGHTPLATPARPAESPAAARRAGCPRRSNRILQRMHGHELATPGHAGDGMTSLPTSESGRGFIAWYPRGGGLAGEHFFCVGATGGRERSPPSMRAISVTRASPCTARTYWLTVALPSSCLVTTSGGRHRPAT